jgi:hypothetical protein
VAGEQFCEAPDKAVRQRLAVIQQRFTSLSLSKFVGSGAERDKSAQGSTPPYP